MSTSGHFSPYVNTWYGSGTRRRGRCDRDLDFDCDRRPFGSFTEPTAFPIVPPAESWYFSIEAMLGTGGASRGVVNVNSSFRKLSGSNWCLIENMRILWPMVNTPSPISRHPSNVVKRCETRLEMSDQVLLRTEGS